MTNDEMQIRVRYLVDAVVAMRSYLIVQDEQLALLHKLTTIQSRQINQLTAQVAALKARFN